MNPLDFAATIVLITASGALAPGPLFFAGISHGIQSGAKSGLIFSIAHTLVEFTLVMLLSVGLLSAVNSPAIRFILGMVGGVTLILFGILQIQKTLRSPSSESESKGMTSRNLLLVGLALTGLNPFFIIWWLTVGAQLIVMALEFASFFGVLFMYACHVWMDYVWLTAVAHFAKMGTNIVGFKWYRILIAGFGAILIYFGFTFLLDSMRFF